MTEIPKGTDAFVVEFARRTLVNLDWIDTICEKTRQQDGSASAYETTQLINSALGLIIVPKEKLGLGKIDRNASFPIEIRNVPPYQGTMRDAKSCNGSPVLTLIYGLRNSFSHVDFKTIPTSDGKEIIEIHFQNHRPSDKNHEQPPIWDYKMTVGQLRIFVEWLAKKLSDGTLLKNDTTSQTK